MIKILKLVGLLYVSIATLAFTAAVFWASWWDLVHWPQVDARDAVASHEFRPAKHLPAQFRTDLSTQIAVQWTADAAALGTYRPLGLGLRQDAWSLNRIRRIEARLMRATPDEFYVDGHDFGASTVNFFVYSYDADKTVRTLIDMMEAGKLPAGMRLGLGHFNGIEATDVTYRPVYPPGLKDFSVEQ